MSYQGNDMDYYLQKYLDECIKTAELLRFVEAITEDSLSHGDILITAEELIQRLKK